MEIQRSFVHGIWNANEMCKKGSNSSGKCILTTSRKVEIIIGKFGFIKRVDKGRIATVKDLESSHFEL